MLGHSPELKKPHVEHASTKADAPPPSAMLHSLSDGKAVLMSCQDMPSETAFPVPSLRPFFGFSLSLSLSFSLTFLAFLSVRLVHLSALRKKSFSWLLLVPDPMRGKAQLQRPGRNSNCLRHTIHLPPLPPLPLPPLPGGNKERHHEAPKHQYTVANTDYPPDLRPGQHQIQHVACFCTRASITEVSQRNVLYDKACLSYLS